MTSKSEALHVPASCKAKLWCRNMINKLGQVLKLYWWEKMDRLGKTPRLTSPLPPRGSRTRTAVIEAAREIATQCLHRRYAMKCTDALTD